jgi:hypothetical protein
MVSFIKRWLFDESFFERFLRGALAGGAQYAAAAGYISATTAAGITALALTIGAGEKNATPETPKE